jgi:hypothetical protein
VRIQTRCPFDVRQSGDPFPQSLSRVFSFVLSGDGQTPQVRQWTNCPCLIPGQFSLPLHHLGPTMSFCTGCCTPLCQDYTYHPCEYLRSCVSTEQAQNPILQRGHYTTSYLTIRINRCCLANPMITRRTCLVRLDRSDRSIP